MHLVLIQRMEIRSLSCVWDIPEICIKNRSRGGREFRSGCVRSYICYILLVFLSNLTYKIVPTYLHFIDKGRDGRFVHLSLSSSQLECNASWTWIQKAIQYTFAAHICIYTTSQLSVKQLLTYNIQSSPTYIYLRLKCMGDVVLQLVAVVKFFFTFKMPSNNSFQIL